MKKLVKDKIEKMGKRYVKFLSNVEEVKNRVLPLLHFRGSQFSKYGHLASVTQKFIQSSSKQPKVFHQKCIFKNFAKFSEKLQCQL